MFDQKKHRAMPSSRGPEAPSLVSVLHNCAAAAAGLQVVAKVHQPALLGEKLCLALAHCAIPFYDGLFKAVGCRMNDLYALCTGVHCAGGLLHKEGQ